MNNASKIDTNWTKIFNKYPILQTIKDEGKYIITAQQIKEFWEPRLMTKHDHSVNRPQIFIDNSLSILPITRGSYIIGAMDLYHDFALSDREKVFDSTDSMPVSSPAFIESIDFNNITSEATAINSIYVSDILRDFLNEPTLLPTVNGRMGAGSMPNWKIQLIKDPALLDKNTSHYIAIPEDNSYCYLLKSKRPRDIDGSIKIK